jgi:hypothetical protein
MKSNTTKTTYQVAYLAPLDNYNNLNAAKGAIMRLKKNENYNGLTIIKIVTVTAREEIK